MINNDIQKLEPGDIVRLFELDMTILGGNVLRFHGHPGGEIVWQGETYSQISMSIEGLTLEAGKTIAPSLIVANMIGDVRGAISALCQAFHDLCGAKLTCHTTFAKYLDGSPDEADEEIVSIWYVEQKVSETAMQVQFELSSPVNFQNQQLPARQIVPRCHWAMTGDYRGESCGYMGPYFDINDEPTEDPSQDKCGGRVDSCKVRFGLTAELPFGGFPMAGKIR